MDKVDVLHILRDPLQEAQGLVEGNGHCDLGQLLEGQREHHRAVPRRHSPWPAPRSQFLEKRRPVEQDLKPTELGEQTQ